MKRLINANTVTVLTIALTGVAVYYFAKKEAGDALNAVNPTSQDNIFYGGANSVGAIISGNDEFNLGRWIYDITH